jgi:chromosome segregation ATPase
MSDAARRDLRDRLLRLSGQRDALQRHDDALRAEQEALEAHLLHADGVADALDQLSREVFGDLVALLEEKLSAALQEVLQQPLRLQVTCRYLRGAAAMELSILRDGHPEDILRGQGGSVANVLSVGLRLFALTAQDPARHRRFLVLDEQDCWLHPSLVPRFVRIIREASRALGLQVLMISHHDESLFRDAADRIYRLTPHPNGVRATLLTPP